MQVKSNSKQNCKNDIYHALSPNNHAILLREILMYHYIKFILQVCDYGVLLNWHVYSSAFIIPFWWKKCSSEADPALEMFCFSNQNETIENIYYKRQLTYQNISIYIIVNIRYSGKRILQ
jgi:hypothetical protein